MRAWELKSLFTVGFKKKEYFERAIPQAGGSRGGMLGKRKRENYEKKI